MQIIRATCISFAVVFASLIPQAADARVGETYAECVRRYGQPTAEQSNFVRGLGVPVTFKVKTGKKSPSVQVGAVTLPATEEEIQVTAWFAKADQREPCWRIDFAKRGAFDPGEAEALLDANKGGQDWGNFDAPQRTKAEGKYFEEISRAIRSDGVRAERSVLKNLLENHPEADRLRIYSREYQQADGANQQQGEQSARDRLKGF